MGIMYLHVVQLRFPKSVNRENPHPTKKNSHPRPLTILFKKFLAFIIKDLWRIFKNFLKKSKIPRKTFQGRGFPRLTRPLWNAP